jgi:hypothetical protein
MKTFEALNSQSRHTWGAWSACVNWRAVTLIVSLVILLQGAFPPGPWHWMSYLSYGPVGVIVSLFGIQIWESPNRRTTPPNPQTTSIQTKETEPKAGS